jgi:hypothetical protein
MMPKEASLNKEPSLAWFVGMSSSDKEAFKTVLLNSKTLCRRILEVLEAMEDSIERKELSDEHFNNPEWAVREARYLGEKRKLKEVKDLFSFIER